MKEKKAYVAKLTQILSAPAEDFLDRDKDTIRKELIEKYNFIQKESLHFIQFDKDIIKIWLVNNKAKVVFNRYGKQKETYLVFLNNTNYTTSLIPEADRERQKNQDRWLSNN